ncbi:MAG: 2,3-bisphosphoglycerate-independent phosphoglycerate mutase [Erysipelotrichaceae bacterium]|nr:2,3-bisphosphoglycerate-independent phosphoglycerate mutase [Erysipelotrichaceae bacterium]
MSKRPLVFVVMDGIGLSNNLVGNAVAAAYKPHLDKFMKDSPMTQLKAHGTAVGLPSDEDMGNSEVGHNALGCGQIYAQGAKLVNHSINTGDIFTSQTWSELVDFSKNNTMHFIGLLSDGNVHSHINHLKALIVQAKKAGIKNVRIHALLDGRDVPQKSGLIYIEDIELFMAGLNDLTFNARIASGGGRMKVTMDRYEAEWGMVDIGWRTHVLGIGRQFASAKEAIETQRFETDVTDQFLEPFVIGEKGEAVGRIVDGDAVVLFNFRGDRALELSRAFEEDNFTKFDRIFRPKVMFAGMLQYDGDLQIPNKFLVTPPRIKNTMSEFLVQLGVKQYAISETQKFGHVTYFWNGNRTEKFDDELETFVEVTSDIIPYEQRPWMKSAQITDLLVEAIEKGEHDFYRVNFPNGDMVGHTGNFQATQIGVESVDLAIGRIKTAVDKVNGILILTADHGNADEMFEKSKDPLALPKPKTAHTLNPVPFIIINADVQFKEGNFGLANVASTLVELMGYQPLSIWEESLLTK